VLDVEPDSLIVLEYSTENLCEEIDDRFVLIDQNYYVVEAFSNQIRPTEKHDDAFEFAKLAHEYLLSGQLPHHLTQQQKRNVKRRIKRNRYELQDRQLVCGRGTHGPVFPVIYDINRLEQIIHKLHKETGHLGRDALLWALKTLAYVPRKLTKACVNRCLASCEACTVKQPKRMSRAPVIPIVTSHAFEKVSIYKHACMSI